MSAYDHGITERVITEVLRSLHFKRDRDYLQSDLGS